MDTHIPPGHSGPGRQRERGLPVKTIHFVRTAILASILALIPAFAAAQKKPTLEEAMGYDGLTKKEVKGIDLVFTRPGATLANYKRVRIDPVEVSFHPNWDPTRTGSRLKLSSEERENIRTGVAKLVQEELAKGLEAKGAYKVVNEAAPDVLGIKAKILNLYVNAPDTQTAGRSRTYTISAGQMTLFMELVDSETGAVLARVVDRVEGRDTGRLELSNSMFNAGEARDAAAKWARALKNGLDKAHEAGAKK